MFILQLFIKLHFPHHRDSIKSYTANALNSILKNVFFQIDSYKNIIHI